jgi:hypothetical protein
MHDDAQHLATGPLPRLGCDLSLNGPTGCGIRIEERWEKQTRIENAGDTDRSHAKPMSTKDIASRVRSRRGEAGGHGTRDDPLRPPGPTSLSPICTGREG